jgi:hypothetical protein
LQETEEGPVSQVIGYLLRRRANAKRAALPRSESFPAMGGASSSPSHASLGADDYGHVLDASQLLSPHSPGVTLDSRVREHVLRSGTAAAYFNDHLPLFVVRAGYNLLGVVDALRRAEAWEDAAETAHGLLRENPPEAVEQVIMLELRLIEAQDTGRHSVATALPPPARRPHVAHQKSVKRGEGLRGWLKRLFRR